MKYPDTKIVALCGGIGGSKLALGLNNVLDQKNLSIITNTGDDFLYLAFYICPDIDTVINTLAGVNNNETGQALDSVTVYTGVDTTSSNNAGEYEYYSTPTGLTLIQFTKEGYNNAAFNITLTEGDTVTLNAALEPLGINDMYFTGFESGDDLGFSNTLLVYLPIPWLILFSALAAIQYYQHLAQQCLFFLIPAAIPTTKLFGGKVIRSLILPAPWAAYTLIWM